jgi:hypothetical protein
MHGKVDKSIASISFENVLKTKEIEQEQQTLMNESCLPIFVHQEERIFHGFQDPVAILLQSSMKEEFVSFISSDFGLNFCFQLPSFTFVCLLKKNVSRGKYRSQLLDWLHWHFRITLLSIHFSIFRVDRSMKIILMVKHFSVWISISVYSHILAVYSVFNIQLRAVCRSWFSVDTSDRSE